MKSLSVGTVAVAALVAVAFGGIAMASEYTADEKAEPSTIVASIVATQPAVEPGDEQESGDEQDSDDAEAASSGLSCSLVEVESTPVEGAEDTPPLTAERILAPGAIECSGTGNERSAEVATVPRFLAHSDIAGSERGAIISAWAKTHANQKSEEGDGGDPGVEDGEAQSGDEASSETGESQAPATSPGRSGQAPGHGGTNPGNGRGH